MNVETETMFKRVVSKIQETILVFRKQVEKVNGRVIHLEDRTKILEQFIQENQDYDPSELMDLRARVSNVDKAMKGDVNTILQILQSMKENHISLLSRIELLEDAIAVKDPLNKGQKTQVPSKPLINKGTVDDILSETDKMLEHLKEE